ncbi:MAG: ferrochelatase, partial [Gammaproteobacteria bacterium]
MSKALLLVNLGSPEAPDEESLRRYLNEFLMDPYVIDTPWPIRRFVLSAFILPRRPAESAAAYRSIWTQDGSPLVVHTQALANALATRVEMPVTWAMRYGEPSLEDAVSVLAAIPGVDTIRLAALYPHHAMSTRTTTIEAARRALRELGGPVGLEVLAPFYDRPEYIRAMASAASGHLAADLDHVLFSYHGLPERHLRKTDPTGTHCLASPDCCETPSSAHATCYRHQVLATTRSVASALSLPEGTYSSSFQSRLGRLPWLRPYTDDVLAELPARGVKKLAVICPAFVSDNLETLEEMGIRGRETFLAQGGERFTLVPCLNEHPQWIETLAEFAQSDAGWESCA